MNINAFTVLFLLLYLFPKETLQILPETKYQENGCYGSLSLEYGFMQGACSIGQVIAVESVTAGTKLQTSGCYREGVSNGFNDTTFSTCCYPASGDCVFTYTSTSNPYVYQRACSGRTTCTTLPVANMLTPTVQCDTSSIYWFTSTYLYMDYYCIEESRIGDASSTTLDNGGNESALYIWNPGYPDAELNAFTYYTCSMETDCNSNINITTIDMRFNAQSGTCHNTITFDGKYSSKSFDCNISNSFEIQNIYISDSNYLVMNVSNEFESQNGLFWLAIQSTDVSGSLIINCPATEPSQNCSDYLTTSDHDYTTTATTSESHTSIPATENDSSTSMVVTTTSAGETTTSESHTSVPTTENHSSTSHFVTTTSSGDTTTSETSKTTTTNTENTASTTMTDETRIIDTEATTGTMTSEKVHSLSDTITTTTAETTLDKATTTSSTMTPVSEFSTTISGATTDPFTTTTIPEAFVTKMTTTPSSEYSTTEDETSTIFASESTTTTNPGAESISTTEGEDQRSTSVDINTVTDASSTASVTDIHDVATTSTSGTTDDLNHQTTSTNSSITESSNEWASESNTDSQVGQATSNEFPWWIIVVVIVVVLVFLAVIAILWRFKNKKALSKKKNSNDHETLTSEEHKCETGHGTYNQEDSVGSSLTTDTTLMDDVKFEDYNDAMDILNTGILPIFLQQNPPERSQLNLLSRATNGMNAKPSVLPARLTPINEHVKHVMTEHAKKKKRKKHNHKDKQKHKKTNKNIDDSENAKETNKNGDDSENAKETNKNGDDSEHATNEEETLNITNGNSGSTSDQTIMKEEIISKPQIKKGNIDSNANLIPDTNIERNQLDIEKQDSNFVSLSKESQLSLQTREPDFERVKGNHDDSQQKEQKKHKKKKHRGKSMNTDKTSAISTLNPIVNRSLRAVPKFDPFLRIVDSASKSAMVTKLGLPRDLTDVDC